MLNTLCTEMYRPLGSADGEWEESSEERTISPYPEPYEALLQQYQAEALYAAWNTLNYREKEMLAAHLGFCPDCFSTLERTGDSSAWYDCAPRKRTPYAYIAVDFGLSSSESAQRICEKAFYKMRTVYSKEYTQVMLSY